MAKKDKKVANSVRSYSKICVRLIDRPKKIRRPARFGPQLLADGLTAGVVSDQGNIIKGVYDAPDATKVDDFVNINSDKFEIMQSMLDCDQSVPQSPNPSGNTQTE